MSHGAVVLGGQEIGRTLEQCYLCIMSDSGQTGERVTSLDEIRNDHDEYLLSLEQQGVLFGAGPFVGPNRWSEEPDLEMIVIRAEDRDEAEARASDEPLTRSGLRRMRIIPWIRNSGTVQLEVRFASREMWVDGRQYRLGSESSPSTALEPAQPPVFACLMRTNPHPPAQNRTVDELRADHQAFLRDLERRGELLAAGPLRDGAGAAAEVGTGLIILRADSLEAAEQLIGQEPYARAGLRTAHVAPWARSAGDSTLSLRLGAAELRVDARVFNASEYQ